MRKEWFFDRFCGTLLAVYAEDGKILEAGAERENGGEVPGNIYKGKVMNVVPGMQAAFVACGMERNAYLPLGEGVSRFSAYDGEGNAREEELSVGDEVLVQIEKLPRDNKGAKVTCALSFVGKNLIYLPTTNFLGISRKIVDPAVREELLKEGDKFRGKGEGFILRTAAQTATKRQLKAEADYLKRMYRAVLDTAAGAPAGACVYREYELPVKAMRDSVGDGVTRIYVGDAELYGRLSRLARMRSDFGGKKVSLYGGKRSMFAEFGLSEQIFALAEPRVPLPSGGYIVIDRTEAMTVIDVNTGRYTGERDLESTVYETNLEAAREIARQVRLRNIGGIVSVDFIDMAEEEHRAGVDRELAEAVSGDRAKCRVFPMTELCVTLFTRKRTNNELLNFLLKPCPHCKRGGYVLSDIYLAMRLRSDILDKFAEGYSSVVVDLNESLMKSIFAGRYLSEEAGGIWKGNRVYLVPHASYHEEQYEVRGDDAPVLSLPDSAQLLH